MIARAPWPDLPPERAGMAAPEALATTRATVAASAPPWPAHPRIVPVAAEHGGIPCLELVAPAAKRTILYFHGGGYRMGQCAGWTGFAAEFAERLAARVILAEYRLAPEHPFPAALNDALAVLSSLPQDGLPLIVAGDSAGGGIAVATTLIARKAGLPPVAGVILLSPWVDLSLSAETFDSNAATELFFPRAGAALASEQYRQGHSANDPMVSPLFSDLAGFPPCLILAGGAETLLADSTRLADRIACAGGSVTLHVLAGMQHVWPVIYPDLPETQAALDAMAKFAGTVGAA